MNKNAYELEAMTKKFRFGTGKTIAISDDQIEEIPYLTALVSAGDNYQSVCDDQGYYKLDQGIKYEDFCFVLQSISFYSVRELFNRLPENKEIMSIIALLDFLGLLPQPVPTLVEVDASFFSTVVCSPLLEQVVRIIKPSFLQDVAVRFAIALAKEEYDFNDNGVVQQIYWYIMFILSAYKLFGPRIRYHVAKIAKHCFSIFSPNLLKSFNKLKRTADKRANSFLSTAYSDNTGGINMNTIYYTENDYCSGAMRSSLWNGLRHTIEDREKLLLMQELKSYLWFRVREHPVRNDLTETVSKYVLEITYERLQSKIVEWINIEINKDVPLFGNTDPYNQPEFDFQSNTMCFPESIKDLLPDEFVKEEIRNCVQESLSFIVSRYAEKNSELKSILKRFQSNHIYSSSHRLHIIMIRTIISCELFLAQCQQRLPIIDDIEQRVLYLLKIFAECQYQQWKKTAEDIRSLWDNIESNSLINSESLDVRTDSNHPIYRTRMRKRLP